MYNCKKRDGIFALQKYYAIALLDPANAHVVSQAVDPFWHAHILHTKQYTAFCKRAVGGYMHHQPLDPNNTTQISNLRTLYDYTLEIMAKMFRTVDPVFWPALPSNASDEDAVNILVCAHYNITTYGAIQPFRLFEPNPRGLLLEA